MKTKQINTLANKILKESFISHTRWEGFLERYIGLVLILAQVSKTSHYYELGRRMSHTAKYSGKVFLVQYLKSAHSMVVAHLSGRPVLLSHGEGVWVANTRGLPRIIPGSLRLLIEAGDVVTIRVVLTILSFYRVISIPGQLKLSTITDKFKGVSTTLNPIEVALVWSKRFKSLVPSRPKGRDTLILSRSAGPNYRTSILGSVLDTMAWKTVASEEIRQAYFTLSDYFQSSLGLLLQEDMETVSGWETSRDLCLGKLSTKVEPAGKVRVFAIADVWTQSVLEPLHLMIFDILKGLECDGSFDQDGALNRLKDKVRLGNTVYSYDLSAATDRLPVDLQVQVLSQFVPRHVATAWKTLLVGREWVFGKERILYSVGQPMGALSSWGMLALTHHFIVQVAANRLGTFPDGFKDYAVLGDDIVIADKAVANVYHSLMTEWLGLDINMSKSVISDKGVMEFAKRIVTPTDNYSPAGAKGLACVLKNVGYLPSVFVDLIGKDWCRDWTMVMRVLRQLSRRGDICRLRPKKVEAYTWAIVGPFGFIPYPGLGRSDVSNSLGEVLFQEVVRACSAVSYNQWLSDRATALKKAREGWNDIEKFISSFSDRLNIQRPVGCEVVPGSLRLVKRILQLQLDLWEYANMSSGYTSVGGGIIRSPKGVEVNLPFYEAHAWKPLFAKGTDCYSVVREYSPGVTVSEPDNRPWDQRLGGALSALFKDSAPVAIVSLTAIPRAVKPQVRDVSEMFFKKVRSCLQGRGVSVKEFSG